MKQSLVAFAILASCAAALAGDLTPRDLNIQFSAGQNPATWHGSSIFRTVHFELLGNSARVSRWLPHTDVGAALSYSKIRQPRSWFGHTYGDPDDHVRGETLFVFARHYWRATSSTIPYLELGTGPMWGNRRVPAATSRLNFASQAGVGVELFAKAKMPLFFGYRFAHISNGGIASRNPGLNVNTLIIGTRLMRLRR
jgi:hypothetical protein